jgi:hypothetical protein
VFSLERELLDVLQRRAHHPHYSEKWGIEQSALRAARDLPQLIADFGEMRLNFAASIFDF